MNPNNYASLEASQRLVEAGVMLETDFYWYVYNEDMCRSLIAADKAIPAPYLVNRASVRTRIGSIPTAYVPAPSMAEVWRELPESIKVRDRDYSLEVGKTQQGGAYAGYIWEEDEYYEHYEHELQIVIDDNPTDALIALLIWVRKEANHE